MTKPIVPKESRLTPLWRTEDEVVWSGQRFESWICKCVCGENCRVRRIRLERGSTKSCGCLRREMGKAKIEKARAAHIAKAQQRRLING